MRPLGTPAVLLRLWLAVLCRGEKTPEEFHVSAGKALQLEWIKPRHSIKMRGPNL